MKLIIILDVCIEVIIFKMIMISYLRARLDKKISLSESYEDWKYFLLFIIQSFGVDSLQ